MFKQIYFPERLYYYVLTIKPKRVNKIKITKLND